MKKIIQISIIATSVLVSGMIHAKDTMDMKGNQPDQMMDQRMQMMKADLKLNAKQEKAFDAFAKRKKILMQDMMGKNQAGMKNMSGTKDMHGGQMNNMQNKKGMQGQQGMMGMMSSLSFEERMNFLQQHAKKMSATAKTGKKFFRSLDAGQKKKFEDMVKN
ncbi:MAG: hypothetical protein ACC635_05665, partial [Acidiferrobacterales bacterium]